MEVGCTAYYSTDGKTITFKNGVLSDNAKEYTGPIEIGGKNYVQVYAMVIKNSNQLASPVASARYTFGRKCLASVWNPLPEQNI